jgi:hypothetical protein
MSKRWGEGQQPGGKWQAGLYEVFIFREDLTRRRNIMKKLISRKLVCGAIVGFLMPLSAVQAEDANDRVQRFLGGDNPVYSQHSNKADAWSSTGPQGPIRTDMTEDANDRVQRFLGGDNPSISHQSYKADAWSSAGPQGPIRTDMAEDANDRVQRFLGG